MPDHSSDQSPVSEPKVGYGQPPVATRFKKGTSGNPRGRPKKSSSLEALLMKRLHNKISITERGVQTNVLTLEALLLAQIKKAMTGDTRAFEKLVRLLPTTALHSPITQDAWLLRMQDDLK